MSESAQVGKDEAAILVTINGEKLQIIMPGKGWSFDEALLAKAVTPKEWAPVEVEERLWVGDPDAWLAVLHVSYNRAGKPFPTEQIGGVNLSEIAAAIMDAFAEVDKASPPQDAEAEIPAAPSPA